MTVITSAELPTRATCFHEESTVLTGNGLIAGLNANQPFNFFMYQNTPANGNSFSQSVFLRAGTYELDILGVTGLDHGQVDWYLDGVLIAAAQDWYAGGTNYNIVKTITGIIIAQDGRHILKGAVNGKNALASDYFLRLTVFWFKQVVD